MEENIIEINNLTKTYKMYRSKQARLLEVIVPKLHMHSEFKALDNLNLNVKKGEVLGILGKNGAGKSTLLKIITGVTTQTSGTININGKISSLLELGTAFNPELTGEENIYQHGQVMGLTKKEIDAKKQEIIDFADIGDHLSQPVKTYSSGMFARLAFACAINVDPDILIVDEVLSVGDMAFQLKCFKKFEEFKERGKTVLFVTHSINDVIRNCTRTVILSNGRKIFDGDVKDGVEQYKKMMVGIDIENEEKNENKINSNIENNKVDEWKESTTENKEVLTYGNKKAEIIDYGIFDMQDKPIQLINNNEIIKIKMKVKFNEDIDEPIFAMSIKDFKSLELAGANTEERNVKTGNYKKGDIITVEFEQRLPFSPDKYTISLGCTKFDKNGGLEVFDRKYDALFLEVASNKNCLGLIEIDTKIKIEK